MMVVCDKVTKECTVVGSLNGVEMQDPVTKELAEGDSTLVARYTVTDEGEIVDQYPGKTDDEVIEVLRAAEEAAVADAPAELKFSKPRFLELFTIEELAKLYTARDTDVVIQIFMDRLDMVDEVDLTSKSVKDAIGYMLSKGMLTEARAQEILSGTFPV